MNGKGKYIIILIQLLKKFPDGIIGQKEINIQNIKQDNDCMI